MTDVAALAGVSRMTVSRVLNDPAAVRPQLRARVQAAITQLGYRRNAAARRLVSARSGTIGLVVHDVTQYGPASVASGIWAAASSTPYTVSTMALAETRRAAPR